MAVEIEFIGFTWEQPRTGRFVTITIGSRVYATDDLAAAIRFVRMF